MHTLETGVGCGRSCSALHVFINYDTVLMVFVWYTYAYIVQFKRVGEEFWPLFTDSHGHGRSERVLQLTHVHGYYIIA